MSRLEVAASGVVKRLMDGEESPADLTSDERARVATRRPRDAAYEPVTALHIRGFEGP